jgi:hypothetical protein
MNNTTALTTALQKHQEADLYNQLLKGQHALLVKEMAKMEHLNQ